MVTKILFRIFFYFQKYYRNDFQLDSWERDPMVCAIMKKKVDKPFEIPQQHLYSGENITSDEIGKKYK